MTLLMPTHFQKEDEPIHGKIAKALLATTLIQAFLLLAAQHGFAGKSANTFNFAYSPKIWKPWIAATTPPGRG